MATGHHHAENIPQPAVYEGGSLQETGRALQDVLTERQKHLAEVATDPNGSLFERSQAFHDMLSGNKSGALEELYAKAHISLGNSPNILAYEAAVPYSEKGAQSQFASRAEHAYRQLAVTSGFDPDHVMSDPHEYFDPIGMPVENAPTRVFVFLDAIAEAVRLGEYIPTTGLSRYIPLALDVNNAITPKYVEIPEEVETELRAVGELSNVLAYGEDHGQVIDDMLRINPTEALSYATELYELYKAAERVPLAYPERYREGVAHGVRELVASSLYALKEHIKAGNATDVQLPLHGEKKLGLTLGTDEPHMLLNSLHLALTRIAEIGTDDVPVITAAKGRGFDVFRFLGTGNKSAICYVRPCADYAYDDRMEYGRHGSGVEASIGYVIDPTLANGRLVDVGKRAHGNEPDNRISIRLDREDGATQPGEVRDPTREQGRLSLDVGSVLGKDTWLGTKIGRFLAYGNMLRNEYLGVEPTLNHVARYFTEADGDADTFAAQATHLQEQLRARALTQEQVRARYARFGRIARSLR